MSRHLPSRSQKFRLLAVACLTVPIGTLAIAQPLTADARSNFHGPVAKASRAVPRSLSLAANRSTRTDRALVADAKALKRCLIRHPQQCGAQRRAVQRAGVRFAAAKRALASAARLTAGSPRTARASRNAALHAPELGISGRALKWTRIAGVYAYVVEGRIAGQAPLYAVVRGDSATPPPMPGATVYYRVRTALNGSSWSAAVSIAFPLPTKSPGSTPGATTPPVDPTPPSEPTKTPVTTPTKPTPPVKGVGTPGEKVDTQAAPVLSVSGKSLSWNQVGGVSTYVLMQRVSGQAEQFSVVGGSSFTPTPVPGKTVYYSVRTAVNGSLWAAEVSITFAEETKTTPPSNPPEESTGTGSTFTEPFVKGFSGIDIDGWGEPAVAQIGEEVRGANAGWLRAEVNWKEIQPTPTSPYNWARFDKYVHDAMAQHLQILPILTEAPSWTSPTNAAAYAAFTAAAVARYGPGTTANMQWFEFWNEPYFPQSWSGKAPEPEAYALDVRAAALAAKAVSPSVKLLVAADYSGQAQIGGLPETHWVSDMFNAVPELGSLINGVAVHPYGDDPSLPIAYPGGWEDAQNNWAFQRIDSVRAQFLAHGVNVPFWITEEGWSTYEMSEAQQAHNYGDLITQVAARPWIRALFSFDIRENEGHATNNQAEFGLLKYGTWQPKLAYEVLKSGFATLN
ncbi:MAG TPA: hypothetical protein VHT29_13895 [Solirubrobacteraceae bacterium]|jgi:hypothetical protein|nr:hypothetical protein [Solirubrobacteraceae bacterium]